MKLTKPLLNRLLSGKEALSEIDKEEVLGHVLKKVIALERPWWTTLKPWGLIATCTAAVLMVTVFHEPPSEFVPRGQNKPSLNLTCTTQGVANDCREGSRLLFKVNPGGFRFFAALARGPAQQTLWYFTQVDLEAHSRDGVLDRAADIGAEHQTGTYEVIGVFSAAPLDKTEVKALVDDPSLKNAQVTRQTLIVKP